MRPALRHKLTIPALLLAALLAGCDTLYSEDMQHGQVFDGQLVVINPFFTG